MKIYLSIFLLLIPFILSAHDFEADGLFYNIVSAKDKTCELGNKTGSALTTPTEQWCFNSIAIPETVEYNGVTFSVIGIGKEAFYFQAGLTSVEMHSNIKYIGASAFAGCRNLSYIDIPNSVTEIGNVAFRYCFNLSYIKFPENLTKISSYILGNCENLKTIVLPNSVNETAPKFAEADAIVVGTPTYYAGGNGQLLAFMDRLFYSTSGVFEKTMKIGAAVVSSRRAGSTSAFDEINKYFTIASMPIASSTYWNEVHGFTAEDVEKDREGLQTMRNLGRNIAFMIKAFRAQSAIEGIPVQERGSFTSFYG